MIHVFQNSNSSSFSLSSFLILVKLVIFKVLNLAAGTHGHKRIKTDPEWKQRDVQYNACALSPEQSTHILIFIYT